MTIDFQPLQQPQQQPTAAASNGIDFQPLTPAASSGPTTGSGIVDKAYAGASGALLGAVNSTAQMGSLANNILKGGAHLLYGKLLGNKEAEANVVDSLNTVENKLGSVVDSARGYIKNDPTGIAAQHPLAYGVGGALGTVGGLVAGSSALSKPLGALGSLVGDSIPMIGKSPIVSNVANLETQAGIIGAASDPEHPIKGAVTSMVTAAPFAAAGAYMDYKLKRAGDIVNFETDNLMNAGVNPASKEGLTRIKTAIKNDGLDYSKYNVQGQIDAKIKAQIQDINPLTNLDTPPAQTIANIAQVSYKDTMSTINNLKKPLVQSEAILPTESANAALASLPSNMVKKLPTSLPEKATFDDIWTYRQDLDTIISTERGRLAMGTAKGTDALNLQKLVGLRQAVTEDLNTGATSLGMADQWGQLNQLYQSKIVPLKALATSSGKLNSPEDVNDAITTLNRLFKARNVNYNQVIDVTKSLGQDGQKLVGQAMLQRMYMDSLNDKGLANAKTFLAQLKKARSTGIMNNIWDLETRQAAQGILKVIDGSDEALRLGSIQDATGLMSKLPSLLGNRAGITLLKMVGSSNTPQTFVRKSIIELANGAAALGGAQQGMEQGTQAPLNPGSQ